MFDVSCKRIKRRKCVRMIQPVRASNPQATFRGSEKTYRKSSNNGITNTQVALINAGGIAATIGAGATIISRRYTPSWSYAAMIGLCSSFLSMFFMTPQIIEKSGKAVGNTAKETGLITKKQSSKLTNGIKDCFKTNKKAIHFKQN